MRPPILPKWGTSLAANSPPAPEWYDFFRDLLQTLTRDGATNEALEAAVADLAAKVDAITSGQTVTVDVQGIGSINVVPNGASFIVSLLGDNESPGGNWYYGTNAAGERGMWPVADGVGVGVGLTKTVSYGGGSYQGELDNPGELPFPSTVGYSYLIDGNLWVYTDDGGDDGPGWDNTGPANTVAVIALATLTNNNTGTLVGITRDAYGRVAGTRPVVAGSDIAIDGSGSNIVISGTGNTITLDAGETIHGQRAVLAADDELFHPDLATEAHAQQVVGIALQSASSGNPVRVRTAGRVTEGSWSWSPGLVFCGANGVLTQSPGPTGWLLAVGRAINPTTIDVDIDTPFIRS